MRNMLLMGVAAALFASASAAQTGKGATNVSEMLEIIRAKHKLPSLAAAVVVDGKVVATNAVGVRRYGTAVKVTPEDKFHIGSDTKSMTATVAGMLVEKGKISWTTTIAQSFPEFVRDIHLDYQSATLEQLLANRGGAPNKPPPTLWMKAWQATGTPAEQRLAFVKGILALEPEAKPGTKYVYSNQGYTIAGVMLEKASGKTWEELMRTMLFEPLGMTSLVSARRLRWVRWINHGATPKARRASNPFRQGPEPTTRPPSARQERSIARWVTWQSTRSSTWRVNAVRASCSRPKRSGSFTHL
jgi:CubicO group peptidase (beta-lactamase class C family)